MNHENARARVIIVCYRLSTRCYYLFTYYNISSKVDTCVKYQIYLREAKYATKFSWYRKFYVYYTRKYTYAL